MAASAWFWPPSGATARGVSLVPYADGLAVPDWTTPTLWPFSPNPINQFQTGFVLASGTPGLAGASADSASGLWTVTWTGNFWRVLSNGAISVTGTLPSGAVYTGCAAPGGIGYFVAAGGRVYSSAAVQIGAWPTGAWFLTSSGTTLVTLLAASGVGLMNANTGVTGRIALPAPITTPLCLSLGTQLAVGGWATAPSLLSANAAALDPQNLQAMLAVGAGFARLWTAPSVYSENWTQTQVVSGLSTLTGLSWRPDGTQALAVSPSSGLVQVITNTAGVLSLTQTFPVASATSVLVGTTSVNAIVAMSGATDIVPLTSVGGVWSTGAFISVFSGVTTLAQYGTTGAVATYGSGIAYINLATGGWTLGTAVNLSFAPSVVTTDSFNTVYAAGSGSLASINGANVAATGSWAGGVPTGIAVHQGRVILSVPTDNRLYIFGQTSSSTWSLETSAALNMGTSVGLTLSAGQLFTLGSGSTTVQGFSGLPYVLTPIRAGAASLWNGSAWTTLSMGIGHVPSAVGFDASGNLVAATLQNTLWTMTTGGVSLGSGTITQYPGQLQTAPMGISALLAAASGLYAATSISGVLTQLE